MKVKLLLIFALLLTAVTGVWAADDSGSCGTDVSYSYVESTHTLTISGTGAMADYPNPSERPWDSYATEIETVIIENGVTSIGINAFGYCASLTTVTIGSGVTSIGDFAFEGCSGLTTVTIPSSVTSIGSDAFRSCSSLTSVTIPASVTSIGDGAFLSCSNLATMTVEAGNKVYDSRNSCNAIIEKETNTLIAGCKGSTIPGDVTSIGEEAFYYCDGLTSVTIPASVTSIGNYAFDGCSNLATMTVETGNTVYDSRNGCNAIIEKESNTLIFGCKNTKIPDDVTSIGDDAFQGCAGLTSVTIPDGVTSIGIYAFESCTGMTTVTIGSGVTYIGRDAFFNCTKVEVVYCNADPEKLEWEEDGCDDFKYDGSTIIKVADAAPWIAKFGDEVNGTFIDTPYVPLSWNYDAATKTLTFSGTMIPSYGDPDERPWIAYVAEVENIVIEDDVTSIGNYAFESCTGMTTVTIGSGVTYIGYDAFYNCTAVTDVYCNADPTKLTWDESGCDDFKPDGTTIIHVADADPWYTKFGSVVHGIFRDPSTVPFSWNYDAGTKTLTFSGTEAIPSCNDPDERPWIDYVEVVENIVINEGVRGIGKYAFYDCIGLTTVTIPASVKRIGVGAFSYCSNISTMTVEAGNKVYDSRNGCNAIIEKETNTLIVGCKNTKIPDDVTNIGDNAFEGCISLTTVTIPAGVTRIGKRAFEGCGGLTTVTIGSGVNFIGVDAFFNCTAVTDVYCYADPVALTWDEDGCDDFKSDGSTIIHVENADPWYAKFTGVVNGIFRDPSTVPFSWNYDAGTKTLTFSGTEAIPSYNDPDDRPWIDYVEVVENIVINEGVRGIGSSAFYDCASLTSVTIPAGVTSIGSLAFSGCSGLTTVTIGSGVTYIGYDAFYNCTAVTDVYCYADPDALTWDEGGCDDFMYDGSTKTKCHVTDAAPWSAFTNVNVDFVGDLAPEATTNVAGEEYWSSYYNSATHLKADDNTTVYKATLSGTTVTLTEISDKVITAGQAVLLKKTTNDPVVLTPCADSSEDDYSNNDLEGVDAETAKESGSDYYVLSYQASKLSFYKYSGTTLGANKAFFKIPANSSREFLDILGEVTGIDGRYKMEDGRSDVYYDLNGRRVMNPTKGIYIVNGSKVVVK